MSRYCISKDGPALYQECAECEGRECESFFCLVVGSKSFNDYKFLESTLDKLLVNQKKVFIVSGDSRGTDTLAKEYAAKRKFFFKEFRANWDKYGNRADFLRNNEMHMYIAKVDKRGVVAFWDGMSQDAIQSFELSKKYKNQIKIIQYKKNTFANNQEMASS